MPADTPDQGNHMTIHDTHELTATIEAALADYGQGIHHGRPLAQHIADALRDEGVIPTPEPETLQWWSHELRGTWAEDPDGRIMLLLNGLGQDIDVWDTHRFVAHECYAPKLTPRPDLAPVDLTPRPVEGES